MCPRHDSIIPKTWGPTWNSWARGARTRFMTLTADTDPAFHFDGNSVYLPSTYCGGSIRQKTIGLLTR